MSPPTKPSRKRASKVAVQQVLSQLSHRGGNKEGVVKKKRRQDNDPKWKKLVAMGAGKSRKQKRQEERRLKKARINAFHQKKLLSSVKINALPTRQDIILQEQKAKKEKKKKLQEKRRKKREKLKEKKEKQDAEELRKQRLLDDNKAEEKTIKKLEKELHFHKNKKTKKKIVPSIFKADGLDYLLDVVNPDKLDDLDEDNYSSDDEGEDDELGLLDALASNIDDDEEDDGERDESSSVSNKMKLSKMSEENIVRTLKERNRTKDESGSEIDQEEPDFDDSAESDDQEGDEQIETEEESDFEMNDNNRTTKKKTTNKKFETDSENLSDSEMDHDDSNTTSKRSKSKKQKMDSNADDASNEEISDDDVSGDGSDFRTKQIKQPAPKMDPYGNIIGEQQPAPKMDPYGNIIGEQQPVKAGSYVPPQKRAKMMGEDSKKKEQLERLKKQLKGLINRLSDSNISPISGQVEELYLKYSRNDMNETLTDLIMLACVGPSLTADRLIMEQIVLVAVLHTNVGNEVGAHFIQSLAVKFDKLYKDDLVVEDKQCDNIILLFTHLYNLKVIHCTLIYDFIRLLVDGFTEKDIEMLLLLLRNCGMSLRKDDPAALKEIILQIQNKAASCSDEFKQQSRVKFMLETIFAIRNNNLRKIPNFDPSHLEHLRKLLRTLIRDRGHSDTDGTLQISLKDLLNAEDKGRWWIIGSAWVGNQYRSADIGETAPETPIAALNEETSDKIAELSRKQRMNTDVRRTIFGILVTAEDYMDAFEKCLRLGLKGGREREIVHVLLDCCLQEKQFNPYYAYLAIKFCQFERKFKMAFQFTIWDKFKMLDDMSEINVNNLSNLLVQLMVAKASPISILKVIEFADIDKASVKFLRTLLLGLLQHPEETIKATLEIIVGNAKLKTLCDGLRLFFHHFILKTLNKKKGLGVPDDQREVVRRKVKFADALLAGEDTGL